MSKLSEYSKFDNLDENSEDEQQDERKMPASTTAAATAVHAVNAAAATAGYVTNATAGYVTPSTSTAPTKTTAAAMRKNETNGRFIYEYNGTAIYEWEQTLNDVTLYVPKPPVSSAKEIHCHIFPRRLELGILRVIQATGKYFIQEDTFGLVEVSESTWYMEEDEGVLVIYLVKAQKGQVWEVALQGKENQQLSSVLDPFSKQQVTKEIMLERFQEENPGFDFRGAEFNGGVPDPREFMGGVKYD